MNGRSLSTIAATVVAAVIVTSALASCGGQSGGSAGSGARVRLTGTTLSGASFDLASYRGRPVVINFFAQWCPACNEEAPDLAAFARAHPEVAFVGVDVNDKVAGGRAFVRKYGISFAVVSDPKGAIASSYGVVGIPTTFFVDRNGVERALTVGASTREGFEEKLKKVS